MRLTESLINISAVKYCFDRTARPQHLLFASKFAPELMPYNQDLLTISFKLAHSMTKQKKQFIISNAKSSLLIMPTTNATRINGHMILHVCMYRGKTNSIDLGRCCNTSHEHRLVFSNV